MTKPQMTTSLMSSIDLKKEFILTYPYNTKQHSNDLDATHVEIENVFNKYKHFISNHSKNVYETSTPNSTTTTTTTTTTQLENNKSTPVYAESNKFKEIISFKGRNYTLFNVTTKLQSTRNDLYDQLNPLLTIGKLTHMGNIFDCLLNFFLL
jgi:hypothetical protein